MFIKKAGYVLRLGISVLLMIVSINIVFEDEVLAKQQKISTEVMRFHVRANSDSDKDQELKLKVKSEVVKYLSCLLQNSENAEQSAGIIKENMPDILKVAYDVVKAQGYDYCVKGYIVNEYFPLKQYGDVALPPGNYNAFRIDIGDAKGKNWWCVLYPALCFADITHGVMPQDSKDLLKNVVGEECFELTDTTTLEFKYLKFLNKWVE